jgi:hypothetical protein
MSDDVRDSCAIVDLLSQRTIEGRQSAFTVSCNTLLEETVTSFFGAHLFMVIHDDNE